VLLIITWSRANNREQGAKKGNQTFSIDQIVSPPDIITEKRIYNRFIYPLHQLTSSLTYFRVFRGNTKFSVLGPSRIIIHVIATLYAKYTLISREELSVQRTRPSGATAFHGRQFRTAAWHSSHAFLPLFGLPVRGGPRRILFPETLRPNPSLRSTSFLVLTPPFRRRPLPYPRFFNSHAWAPVPSSRPSSARSRVKRACSLAPPCAFGFFSFCADFSLARQESTRAS